MITYYYKTTHGNPDNIVICYALDNDVFLSAQVDYSSILPGVKVVTHANELVKLRYHEQESFCKMIANKAIKHYLNIHISS
jgi:hypothetical protein